MPSLQFRKFSTRFSALAIALLLCTFLSVISGTEEANAAGAVVNVPVVVLFVNCPDARAFTSTVGFAYYRLDGTIGSRNATKSNGGLTTNTGTATVQFYSVSIDWLNTTSLFEFTFTDGSVFDLYIDPTAWNYDRRNGNISAGFGC